MANTCIMTDHTPMQMEKYYTFCIERKWHIPYNPPRLATGLLVSNEFNSREYNIDDGSGGSDVGMYHQALTGILTEQKCFSDCKHRVFKSSSLVSVPFI